MKASRKISVLFSLSSILFISLVFAGTDSESKTDHSVNENFATDNAQENNSPAESALFDNADGAIAEPEFTGDTVPPVENKPIIVELANPPRIQYKEIEPLPAKKLLSDGLIMPDDMSRQRADLIAPVTSGNIASVDPIPYEENTSWLLKPQPLSSEDQERALSSIKNLGSDKFQIREEASRELRSLGKDALPVLNEATKDSDLEVQTRARTIINSLNYEAAESYLKGNSQRLEEELKRSYVGGDFSASAEDTLSIIRSLPGSNLNLAVEVTRGLVEPHKLSAQTYIKAESALDNYHVEWPSDQNSPQWQETKRANDVISGLRLALDRKVDSSLALQLDVAGIKEPEQRILMKDALLGNSPLAADNFQKAIDILKDIRDKEKESIVGQRAYTLERQLWSRAANSQNLLDNFATAPSVDIDLRKQAINEMGQNLRQHTEAFGRLMNDPNETIQNQAIEISGLSFKDGSSLRKGFLEKINQRLDNNKAEESLNIPIFVSGITPSTFDRGIITDNIAYSLASNDEAIRGLAVSAFDKISRYLNKTSAERLSEDDQRIAQSLVNFRQRYLKSELDDDSTMSGHFRDSAIWEIKESLKDNPERSKTIDQVMEGIQPLENKFNRNLDN